jgi:hypothetical protein
LIAACARAAWAARVFISQERVFERRGREGSAKCAEEDKEKEKENQKIQK